MLSILEKLKFICQNNISGLQQCHAACIVRGSRPVVFSGNNDRSYLHGKICSSGHAEQNVIMNYFGPRLSYDGRKWIFGGYAKCERRPLRKHRLIVVRVNHKGEIKNSTPCVDCVKLMVLTGLMKIIYSDDDGELIIMRIENIPRHISKGSKLLSQRKL